VENSRPAKVRLADAFGYPGVASAYRHRPPYPDMVFDVLTGLITDTPTTVLDLGAGEGALARPLAARVDQVDAVDISAAMIEEGRRRPGGGAANLRWIVGAAETAPLGGPYAPGDGGREHALDALAGDARAAGRGDDRRRVPGARRAQP
jgi:SAM-dependent methyltransferase